MPYGDGIPQLEDGFARIANEILAALARTDLTGAECRCIFHLFRQTYGWSDGRGQAKKSDVISYSQWQTGTGLLDMRNLKRTLALLVTRKIFTKSVLKRLGKNSLTIWGFQKNYRQWNGWTGMQRTLEVVSSGPLLTDEAVAPTPLPEPKVVAPKPLVTEQPVASTPPVPSQVVAQNAQSSGLDDTRSSGLDDTHNRHIKDNIKDKVSKKENTKRKTESFEEYCQALRQRYPDVNFDLELEKWRLWWSEGGRVLKRPKSALFNWIQNALKDIQREKSSAEKREPGGGYVRRGTEGGCGTESARLPQRGAEGGGRPEADQRGAGWTGTRRWKVKRSGPDNSADGEKTG